MSGDTSTALCVHRFNTSPPPSPSSPSESQTRTTSIRLNASHGAEVDNHLRVSPAPQPDTHALVTLLEVVHGELREVEQADDWGVS